MRLAEFQHLAISEPNLLVNDYDYRTWRWNWLRGQGWPIHVINRQDRFSKCYWEFRRKKKKSTNVSPYQRCDIEMNSGSSFFPYDLWSRLGAKPILLPQRQRQMETLHCRYSESISLDWGRRLMAPAGWKSGSFLIWKMKGLDWIIFPPALTFCVSLILHQNGVFLISSLLLPFWDHFSYHYRSRLEFPISCCIELPNLCR